MATLDDRKSQEKFSCTVPGNSSYNSHYQLNLLINHKKISSPFGMTLENRRRRYIAAGAFPTAEEADANFGK